MVAPEDRLTDIFESGAKARRDGLKPSDNPHPIGSAERAEWDEGFRARCDLDEEDDPASTRVQEKFD